MQTYKNIVDFDFFGFKRRPSSADLVPIKASCCPIGAPDRTKYPERFQIILSQSVSARTTVPNGPLARLACFHCLFHFGNLVPLEFDSQLSYFSIGTANDDDEEDAREQRRRAREERKKMREAELAGTAEVINTNRYGV